MSPCPLCAMFPLCPLCPAFPLSPCANCPLCSSVTHVSLCPLFSCLPRHYDYCPSVPLVCNYCPSLLPCPLSLCSLCLCSLCTAASFPKREGNSRCIFTCAAVLRSKTNRLDHASRHWQRADKSVLEFFRNPPPHRHLGHH